MTGMFRRRQSKLGLLAAVFLAISSIASDAGAAEDAHEALLEELSHGDSVPVSVYLHMLGDQTAAEVPLGIKDRVLVYAASQEWVVINVNHLADAGDMIHDLDHQLVPFGQRLTAAQRQQIADAAGPESGAALKPQVREELAGRMYGPVAGIVGELGLKILNLTDGTGLAKIAVVSPATYERWRGFEFSNQLKVEDGSATFAAQLMGTRYEGLLGRQ